MARVSTDLSIVDNTTFVIRKEKKSFFATFTRCSSIHTGELLRRSTAKTTFEDTLFPSSSETKFQIIVNRCRCWAKKRESMFEAFLPTSTAWADRLRRRWWSYRVIPVCRRFTFHSLITCLVCVERRSTYWSSLMLVTVLPTSTNTHWMNNCNTN